MTKSQYVGGGPILVTGGDSLYFPMIEELHQSIRAALPESPPALGVIDAGLTSPQVWRLRHDGVTVVQPRSLPDFPAASLRKRPALAANLGKLWLDRHAGVFALRADAPHWYAMRRWQQHILRRGKPFTSDQIAMALAVHADGLPVELLPDTCNYITAWRFDPWSASLCEYFYPYPRIGIVHLAGQKTMRFDPTATIEVPDLEGGVHRLSLRYGHFQRMAAVLAAGPVHKADPVPVRDTVLP